GIKKEVLPKLFRIDETVSTEGTNNEQGSGIGLLLCKELIEKHGSDIWEKTSGGKDRLFVLRYRLAQRLTDYCTFVHKYLFS
ncbi:MAG: ATP-binding protein, partial [Bacteroidota bacterium]|nr:ATP-binding protein [Bacteroidota bacterium]